MEIAVSTAEAAVLVPLMGVFGIVCVWLLVNMGLGVPLPGELMKLIKQNRLIRAYRKHRDDVMHRHWYDELPEIGDDENIFAGNDFDTVELPVPTRVQEPVLVPAASEPAMIPQVKRGISGEEVRAFVDCLVMKSLISPAEALSESQWDGKPRHPASTYVPSTFQLLHEARALKSQIGRHSVAHPGTESVAKLFARVGSA